MDLAFDVSPIGESGAVAGGGVAGMETHTLLIIAAVVIVAIILAYFVYYRNSDQPQKTKETMLDSALVAAVGRGYNVPNDMGYAGPISTISELEKARVGDFSV